MVAPVVAPPPPAAAPPPANLSFGPGNRRSPIVGDQVDYHSGSYRCWIPAVVVHVDPETGNLALNVKQQALSLQDQQICLRPRTKPDQAHLKWVRTIVREGRIDDEALELFSHHAITQTDARGHCLNLLHQGEALGKLGAEIDALLGVCGTVVQLVQEVKQLPRLAFTIDDFKSVFWTLVSNVNSEYGAALPRKEGIHHRMAPTVHYDFQKTLGKGTYGLVKLAVKKQGWGKRAVKIISKQKMRYAMDQLQLEIDHLCALDHPHIVKLYEYYDDQDHVFLITDFCSGGDLQQAVYKRSLANSRFPERTVSDLMRQVMSATAHVHARGIVHMDIKSANIMIMPSKGTLVPVEEAGRETMAEEYDKPHAVLIDLGVAQLFNPGNFTHNRPIGTPATMAPEVWKGTITPKADVYSCGVVLFELLSLKLPLKVPGDREGGARFWLNPPQVDFGLLQPASQGAEDLCRFMMNYERMGRPSAQQCLSNAFLRESLEDELSAIAAGPGAPKISPEIVKRLTKLPERSVLYKSVALSIAREWPPNQMPTIRRAFQELSECSGSVLNIRQVSAFLQTLNVPASIADKVADAMDMNRDGNVEFTEFVAACTYLGSDQLEKFLWDAFREADSDDDNLLSQHDIGKLMPAEQGEVVQDVFQSLTGRTERGARCDWDTFRRHFKSADHSERREREQACAQRREEPKPFLEQGLEQALDFVEKMKQGFFNAAGSRAATPARGAAPAQRSATPAAAAPRGSAPALRGGGAAAQRSSSAAGAVRRSSAPAPAPAPWAYAPAARGPAPAEVQEGDLRRLAEMGFSNREKCVAVLQRHRNELCNSAIEELVHS